MKDETVRCSICSLPLHGEDAVGITPVWVDQELIEPSWDEPWWSTYCIPCWDQIDILIYDNRKKLKEARNAKATEVTHS